MNVPQSKTYECPLHVIHSQTVSLYFLSILMCTVLLSTLFFGKKFFHEHWDRSSRLEVHFNIWSMKEIQLPFFELQKKHSSS